MERSRNLHVWLYGILIAGVIAALVWGFSLQKNVRAANIDLENQYNRAFHELVGHVDNIDTMLSKCQLANSTAQVAKLSSDIFRESTSAKSCLGELPTSEIQLDNTAKFLSQVGDYTYVLSQDMINGNKMSDEAYENLANLNEYASSLKQSLIELQSEIYNGNISFSAKRKNGNVINTVNAANSDILADLENVEKSFEQYPSLIYDGPFSEHIENQESVKLKEAGEITKEEAFIIAERFLGDLSAPLIFQGESQNTAIEAYSFVTDTQNDQVCISITKKGGYVLYFLENISVKEENYDLASATEEAMKFLESHGIENMVSSYYEKNNSIAVINFASAQDEVTCYSDLIKVRVALDTGKIVGMESMGYLMNHKYRDLPEVKLSVEEAREYISTNLEVTATKLALIPKDSLQEILCYEFKGTFKDKNFIIYVNAENGREENILILLESPEGILTI